MPPSGYPQPVTGVNFASNGFEGNPLGFTCDGTSESNLPSRGLAIDDRFQFALAGINCLTLV